MAGRHARGPLGSDANWMSDGGSSNRLSQPGPTGGGAAQAAEALLPQQPAAQVQLLRGSEEPLSLDKLWELLQVERGFHSSSSGEGDDYRLTPCTLPVNLDGPGAPVGKGFETFAVIQILDKEGKQVGVACESYDTRRRQKASHAERRCIRALDQHHPGKVPDGRIIVVVDQDPCPEPDPCLAHLENFAKGRSARKLEVYVPQRDSLLRPGRKVSPKTASRSSYQAKRPATTLRKFCDLTLGKTDKK